MEYVHAALTLHEAGKEIDEANMKKILEAIGVQADEARVKAIVMLATAVQTPKRAEIERKKEEVEKAESLLTPELKRLERRLEGFEELVNTRLAAINERLVSIEKATLIEPKTVETVPVAEQAPTEAATAAVTPTSEAENEGRYLYCVIPGVERKSFGKIGIEGNEVYTIPYKDISAVVHNCPAEPYRSEDEEVVKGWVMAHQDVIDAAWKEAGTVLPCRFDTIIKGGDGFNAEENLKKWLKEDYENLKGKLERFKSKAEVGVQIYWDPKVIGQRIMETSEEIKRLKEEMGTKPEGTAYFFKMKIEEALKKEMEARADRHFRDFYERIKKCAEDIRVEKPKKEKDKQMIMNLSVLIDKDKIKELGAELSKINEMKGFSVRFTGPWPPYSFAG